MTPLTTEQAYQVCVSAYRGDAKPDFVSAEAWIKELKRNEANFLAEHNRLADLIRNEGSLANRDKALADTKAKISAVQARLANLH